MLWFKNLFLLFFINLQKATLIYELKSLFHHLLYISKLLVSKRAKQLRAHGKPWMQRVPYTFPLHKLPPELRFLKRFSSVSFCLSVYCLDKIKVGGDSCLTATFRSIKSQFTVLQNWRLCWGFISIMRGYLKGLGFILKCFLLFALFVLFFRGVLGIN